MRIEPTRKQLEILILIAEHREAHRISPSYREIAQAMERSVATIAEHVEALREIGLLVGDVGAPAIPTDAARQYLSTRTQPGTSPKQR